MEKRFTALAAIGTFVILSLVIVFFIIYSGSSTPCTTKECVQSASELLTHLDPSVDPCKDFYEFTCGKFLRTLSEHDAKDLADYMRDEKLNKIRHMMEEGPSYDDTETLAKTKSLYRSCVNETAIEENGTKDVRDVLRGIGGWPLLERGDWRENYFDWKNATYHLRQIGIEFDAFINIDVGINQLDTTRYIVNINKGIHLDIEDKHKKFYHDYMVEVAMYFGADKNRAEQDSKEVIEFQSQLKRTTSDGIKYADLYNPRILSQLQYDFPGIPWVDYINGVLYPSATVTRDEVVNIADYDYFEKFLELLYRTPKRILGNFMSWHVIQSNIQYLPRDLRKYHEKFWEGTEIHKIKSRRDTCAEIIRNKLPDGVEASYVRKFISDDAKRLTKEIIDQIKKQFVKILDDLDWLDENANKVAKEKLASTKDYIAHTQEAPGRRKLNLIYSELEINPDNPDFLASVLHVDLLNLNLRYQKLMGPVYEEEERNELKYSVKGNTLTLPSYYLEGLFFEEDRPKYMNYGALGTVIAYQLSNLLLEGRLYDIYGNLRESSGSQSLLNYDTRAKCITKQYKEFYIPFLGRNINASLTQDDDVALLVGKIVAYQAYKSWSENHDAEQILPGLNYGPKELFWISSATYECSQQPPELLRGEILKRRRSIPRYRVVGPLRNIEGFSTDFGCPAGSYMNSREKCPFW